MTILVTTAPTAAAPSPNAEVAAAAAWLALANQSLRVGATTDAITAAKSGIFELGGDYKPLHVRDDTEIKIGMADDNIDNGKPETGAKQLTTVLQQRVELYFEKYKTVRRGAR